MLNNANPSHEKTASGNFIIPKLRDAVEILKSRLNSVPNNHKLALHNPRFKYYSKVSIGPGTYEIKRSKGSSCGFNNSPRLQSNLVHDILSKIHTEFKKSSSRKASSVFIEKKNKQNAIHFPLYCQKLRDNNRKHLQKIENNLKNRQELRTF